MVTVLLMVVMALSTHRRTHEFHDTNLYILEHNLFVIFELR